MTAKRFPARLAIVMLAPLLLQGCVVGLVPLAAGGLIGRDALHHGKTDKSESQAAPTTQLAAGAQAHSAAPAKEAAAPPAPGSASLAEPAVVQAPAPSRANSPAPATAAASYGAFFTVTRNKVVQEAAGKAQHSMLLLDPAQMSPALQPCGHAPPAVLLDLDPKGSLLPLSGSLHARPGLARKLSTLRAMGVTIYWISGHQADASAAIHHILASTGLDPDGKDKLIVMQGKQDSKQAERQSLGTSQCLLAIAGSSRDDFDELYDYLRDPSYAAPLDGLIGHGWFLVPDPVSEAGQTSGSKPKADKPASPD